MKSIAIPKVVAIWAALALAGCATTAPSSEPAALRDPLLKLDYDPAKVAFEPAPADLVDRCPDLANARWGARLWVYARTPAPGGDLVVVAGQLVAKQPGDADMTNDHGAVLRLGAADCTLLGPAAEPFAAPEAYTDTIPAPALTALADDAARRYSAAFTRPGLAAAMTAQGKRAADLPPPLATAFAGELAGD